MTETTLATVGQRADYDVLKAEVHRKAMEEIAMEMGITLVRTSGSPVVTEAKDLSCAVLDEKVEQTAFATFVGLHISTSFLGVRALLDNYDVDDVKPGDAFIVNDPHTSGALHEGDVGVIMPYFYDDELVAWGYVNEHTIDVGGSGVSGFAASARDCYAEGLRFPALRFMQEGKLSHEWRLFIHNNVRAPSAVLNDLRSMVAAVNTGERRLKALIDRMGLEQHREFCEINKGLSERLVRERIAALPDGRYQSMDWVEYDGLGEALLLEVLCTMDIEGDEMKFTFSGDTQIAGPINGATPAMLGQTMNTLQCVLLYDVPANAGLWRPIEFDLGPEGTVVNSVPPAPVSFAHCGAGMKVDKMVRDVLSQAASLSSDPSVRSRVCSQPCEGVFLTTLAGVDRRSGQPTVVFPVAPTVGMGGPAQTTGDGQDTYSNTCNLGIGMAAVEVDEAASPMLVLWRKIQPSTGGAGMTRGGNGTTTAFQIYGSDEMSGTVSNNAADVPPRGSGGGMPGSATEYNIFSGTEFDRLVGEGKLPEPETLGGKRQDVPAYATVTVKEGDVFFLTNGGGGGLGDPLCRDPHAVARDLADGYVLDHVVRSVYGVVIGDDGAADEPATEATRAEIRNERLGERPSRELLPANEIEIGVSVRVDGDSWTCGYCAGDLGPVSENYRTVCIERTREASETLAELGMKARPHPSEPVILADYFCPGCGSCVRTDVALEGSDMAPAPQLAGTTVGAA
jgi:N-methylhydantoinase B